MRGCGVLVGTAVAVATAVSVGTGVSVGSGVGVAVSGTDVGVSVAVASSVAVDSWSIRSAFGTLVVPPLVGIRLAVGVTVGLDTSREGAAGSFSDGPAAYDVKHPASTKRTNRTRAAPIAWRT